MVYDKKIVVYYCLFLFMCTFSCKQEMAYYETAGEAFATSFHIKYKYAKPLVEEIHSGLKTIDLSLNPFNRESIIYKVNNNEPVEIDEAFITVFNKAHEVSVISGGRYDISCAPLVNLWGFGFSKMEAVNQAIIDSLKQFVGYEKVRLEGKKLIKEDPRIQLNASSIAKGYACDIIAEIFDSLSITDYMIEIGGEVHAKGKNSKGRCWQIEITKPVDDASGQEKERMDVVELCDKSMATSGNYRNYYLKDGKKIAHTINPLTGYPAESNILSASVLYTDCMTADAFATTFMTMDLETAVSVAEQIPGLDYLFIYADSEGNLREKRSLNMDITLSQSAHQ
ncbi:MAG: FAD:protein FMN transferase [Dysgonamonadaceae bacterium]|jgi:thiamine biosynthesis lipoprotein|nr:FAD:protein FMN transferase [Dysgonamonadaceae bacterium]